ncbi:NAD/FAD-dependent oxidoreductase [Rhodococcoides trifolii]|uniref:NAD/FAD-dependent oxidoreductase n=1 Tax=Rhodococcoides trifolii TaxID=908250 RepID=A0A917D7G9_9NOCA|nr:NAD(P)-binding protein [Rhodococcus trifolii]GGG13717.1 NAD/FAD-dependent oxidoreductase [Rhodococcus trifolii]
MTTPHVTVVGAGIAGAACAVALRDAGLAVRIVDRGRAPGGRMASPELHGRRVDTGAGYFTVKDDGFASIVDGWAKAGLAHEWTDTFGVVAAGSDPETKTGPMRWATANGLRSLVRSLLDGFDVVTETIDHLPDGDVVIAMPDPQAARLVSVPDAVDYDPVIAVVAEFGSRAWPFENAAFVNDHPDINFVADDGARRGDGAPVLVAHTTAERAGKHLDDPQSAIDPVLRALKDVLDVADPVWTHAHRWTFAKPAAQHESSFGYSRENGRIIGFAGDQWCPSGSPRVESAWMSGTALGKQIAADT